MLSHYKDNSKTTLSHYMVLSAADKSASQSAFNFGGAAAPAGGFSFEAAQEAGKTAVVPNFGFGQTSKPAATVGFGVSQPAPPAAAPVFGAPAPTGLGAAPAPTPFSPCGLTAANFVPVPAPRTNADHRQRLVSFYQIHNPGKLSKVDAALEKYAGQESILFQNLEDKYGESKPTTVTSTGVQHNAGNMDPRLGVERNPFGVFVPSTASMAAAPNPFAVKDTQTPFAVNGTKD
jgi:hypothetical protein